MSIQRILCLLAFFSVVLSASSQTSAPFFSQGFGLSGSHSYVQGHARAVNGSNTNESAFSLRLRTYGLTYLARVHAVQLNGFSISIGSSLTAGWSVSRKYNSTDIINGTSYTIGDSIKATHFAFDVPVFVDFNIGMLSAADESKRRFGVYVGAGYAYSYTTLRLSVGNRRYDGFDPVLRAGIRMGRAWQNRWSLNFSLRGSTRASETQTYVLQILKEL